MSRPTEDAQRYFKLAEDRFQNAVNMTATGGHSLEYNLAMGSLNMCTALANLNTGLRATYMLLEEVKTLLQRPR